MVKERVGGCICPGGDACGGFICGPRECASCHRTHPKGEELCGGFIHAPRPFKPPFSQDFQKSAMTCPFLHLARGRVEAGEDKAAVLEEVMVALSRAFHGQQLVLTELLRTIPLNVTVRLDGEEPK